MRPILIAILFELKFAEREVFKMYPSSLGLVEVQSIHNILVGHFDHFVSLLCMQHAERFERFKLTGHLKESS